MDKLTLKPVTLEEFESLRYGRGYSCIYRPIINEFMCGDNDISELFYYNNIKTVMHSIGRISKESGYKFLIRRKENRIFLLKNNKSNRR